MKRFMKGCAVTALIFAVLGSLLAFVGSRVAGRTTMEQVVEDVTRGKIHLNPGAWWNWRFWAGDRSSSAPLAEEDVGVIDELCDSTDYAIDYGQWDWDESNIEFIDEYEITKGEIGRAHV